VSGGTIAVDTSAIVAVAAGEADADAFHESLLGRKCVIGTPTVLEAHLVLSSPRFRDGIGYLQAVIGMDTCEVIDFSAAHLTAARAAFDLYGKGRHPRAALNYGDCMAYAVAKLRGVPLLFKGGDFRETDIEPALRP
jgi:ribonuclease VapC